MVSTTTLVPSLSTTFQGNTSTLSSCEYNHYFSPVRSTKFCNDKDAAPSKSLTTTRAINPFSSWENKIIFLQGYKVAAEGMLISQKSFTRTWSTNVFSGWDLAYNFSRSVSKNFGSERNASLPILSSKSMRTNSFYGCKYKSTFSRVRVQNLEEKEECLQGKCSHSYLD